MLDAAHLMLPPITPEIPSPDLKQCVLDATMAEHGWTFSICLAGLHLGADDDRWISGARARGHHTSSQGVYVHFYNDRWETRIPDLI